MSIRADKLDNYLGFLHSAGAERISHSGRTLFDHLYGVMVILNEQDEHENIVTAGLFHSVYGTNAFPRSIMNRQHRHILRGLIGGDAERLVYLFCTSDRPKAWLDSSRFLPQIHQALIRIEIANLCEQNTGKKIVEKLKELLLL